MPELPEVETIRRQLEEEVVGLTIIRVTTNWPKAFQPSYGVVQRAIVGRSLEAVERQAKLLIFKLSSGRLSKVSYLLFHLKLTGRLLVRQPADPPDEFTRAVFTLKRDAGEKELRFADARKFGFVRLLKDEAELGALRRGYGPEPFRDLDLAKFKEALGSSARPVKIVLMDQAKMAGVGNIYANEALWLAKIDPRRPSNKIGNDRLKDLYEAVLRVLKLGLKYGGASDNSYVQVHGEKGEYQEHFLVYGRQNQPCARCRTELARVRLGGRGTFYCPACQK